MFVYGILNNARSRSKAEEWTNRRRLPHFNHYNTPAILRKEQNNAHVPITREKYPTTK
jgi:hypothetical protein